MGKINTSVVKTSFSKNNINQYKLSILCGVDSLCYCVYSQKGEVLVLKKFDLAIPLVLNNEAIFSTTFQEIWEKETILSYPFPTIHIAFVRPHYTIIPNKLYQSANKASYLTPLKANAAIPELYQVNELPSINAKLIFSLPQAAIEFFESKYTKGTTYYNSFTPLINGIAKEMRSLSGKHIWLNVHAKLLQIILFDGQSLIFSNQFPFETEKDFLYYTLLVYSQFKLNPEEIPLHISGQLARDSVIYDNLYRYIRNISFTKIATTYQLNSQLINHPNYFFFDLLSIGA
ncbi:MAG: DUF3822 family protein [Saprospiraceae bacterium]